MNYSHILDTTMEISPITDLGFAYHTLKLNTHTYTHKTINKHNANPAPTHDTRKAVFLLSRLSPHTLKAQGSEQILPLIINYTSKTT